MVMIELPSVQCYYVLVYRDFMSAVAVIRREDKRKDDENVKW